MTIALCLVVTLTCGPAIGLTACVDALLSRYSLDTHYCRDMSAKHATGNAARAMRRALGRDYKPEIWT